jgi:hypothetical protein
MHINTLVATVALFHACNGFPVETEGNLRVVPRRDEPCKQVRNEVEKWMVDNGIGKTPQYYLGLTPGIHSLTNATLSYKCLETSRSLKSFSYRPFLRHLSALLSPLLVLSLSLSTKIQHCSNLSSYAPCLNGRAQSTTSESLLKAIFPRASTSFGVSTTSQ